MTLRSLHAVHPAERDDIRDLITRRPVPGRRVEQVDPFLFLNHHGPQVYRPNNQGLPFGPHPHRGFETVTFILEGELAHADTGGHESVIRAGGVQWMTAGRGLVHSELSPESFKRSGGPLEILQLWVNLPSNLKMVAPRYIGLQANEIPTVPAGDARVQLTAVSGQWFGATGPIPTLIDVQLAIVRIGAGASVTLPAPASRNVFCYLVKGDVGIGGVAMEPFNLVEFKHDGDEVEITASTDAVVLFGHAEPIGEPVVSHGPFVMNTREEINQAIRDYQAGKMDGAA
jgi:redox-sensitive bicupin YhaK (pirin superfamily)